MTLHAEDRNVSDRETPLLGRLLATLEEMIKRHQKLLSALQQEKRLIIEGNVDDLSLCLIEKERLLGELKQLEETRLRQIDPLAKWFGRDKKAALFVSPEGSADVPEITLRQLMDFVSVPDRKRLSSCYERLRALSASVSEINQLNGLLSARILKQVNALLGLLTHLSTMPSVYQSSGLLTPDFQRGYSTRPTGWFHLRG